MKLYTILLLCCISFAAWAQVPDTQTHKVQTGETKYGISRQYGISIETLEKYNPDVKGGLKSGMMLLVPSADEKKPEYKDEQPMPGSDRIIHHVKAGETLYSLARQYEVSLSELNKLNPELTNGGLKEGMVLFIPNKAVVKDEPRDTNFYWHQVLTSETAWMISRTYQISLDSLYILNPEAEVGIRLGQMLKLPINRTPGAKSEPKDGLASDNLKPSRPIVVGEKLADTADGYILYPVKTGDTFYNLKQRFLTDRDELVKINPELSTGLQVDKYILIPIKQEKLPSNFFDKVFNNSEIVGPDSDPSMEHFQTRDSMNTGGEEIYVAPVIDDTLEVDLNSSYKVAVLLPFYSGADAERYEGGVNPKSSVAIDFYNALLMAADTLTKQGMKLQLKVYDTRNDDSRVRRIISELKVDQPDLVIGPLFKSNVEKVAEGLEPLNIKVVSPLSSTVETAGHPNLIKCIPSTSARVEKIAHTINTRYAKANLIFLDFPNTNGIGQTREISELIARLNPLEESQSISRYQVTPLEGDLRLDSIMDLALEDSVMNLVIALTEDKVFLSTLVGVLRGGSKRDSTGVRLIVSSRIMDINTLDFNYLNDLQVTMPNNNFVDYQDNNTKSFIQNYRESYLEEPSKYAFQGYDVGMFFLSKLWRAGPYFDRSIQSETRMLSTGFHIRPSGNGGYENQYMLITRVLDYELVLLNSETDPVQD